MPPMRHTNSGFTVVELAVSIPLIAMVVTVFLAMLLSSLSTVGKDRVLLELNSDNQVALDIIERDIRYSTLFASSVPTQFSDPYGATNAGTAGINAWSHKGIPNSATKRVLMLRSQATTTNPYAFGRKTVFINGAVSNPYALTDPALNCTTKITLNTKLPFYTVYFVRNSGLYRRTLIDTTTPLCASAGNTQYQKLSCPPELRSSWNGVCQAQDELIATNVSAFSVDYYQRDEDNPTIFTLIADAYTSSSTEILETARDADVSLTLTRTGEGKPLVSTLSLRASKVNEE